MSGRTAGSYFLPATISKEVDSYRATGSIDKVPREGVR